MAVVSFDEVKDYVDAQATQLGDFYGTVKWYYDNGKISSDGEGFGYDAECMLCHQKFWNPDPVAIVNVCEGCRNAHVHQLDAYTKEAPQW